MFIKTKENFRKISFFLSKAQIDKNEFCLPNIWQQDFIRIKYNHFQEKYIYINSWNAKVINPMFLFSFFYWDIIDIIQCYLKKSSLLQGSGSLLTAHVLKHMEPKYADCGSDRMVYTGEAGWLFDEWERGLYNKWLNQMWLKLLRKFRIDASVAEHHQRKENAGTKYYE